MFTSHGVAGYSVRSGLIEAINHISQKPTGAEGAASHPDYKTLHFPACSGRPNSRLPACLGRRWGPARAPPRSSAFPLAPPLPLAPSQWEGFILQGVTRSAPPRSCKSEEAAGSSYSAEGDASAAPGSEFAEGAVSEQRSGAEPWRGRPGAGRTLCGCDLGRRPKPRAARRGVPFWASSGPAAAPSCPHRPGLR